MPADLTIVICTHDRVRLLERALASLDRARRPDGWQVEILVVANACTDGTVEFLRRHADDCAANGSLPLRFAEEPQAGKSRALNRAIGMVRTSAVAYVDDDHRVDEGYLAAVCAGFDRYPEASLLCGRIIPDWDGTEPAWVHDTGPYRIYPLPVPRFELGDEPLRVEPGRATPGGGNLALRTELFARVGSFAVGLGPTGHDLGGAEDTDWVRRAIALGALVQYVPDMVQYHYVDAHRLRLPYLLRKAFSRTSSVVRVSDEVGARGTVPAFLYRKVGEYAASAVFTLDAARRRFFLVRTAAAMGEIDGVLRRRRSQLTGEEQEYARQSGLYRRTLAAWASVGLLGALLAFVASRTFPQLALALLVSALAGGAFTSLIFVKSIVDFTRTGPHITEEVMSHYRGYLAVALGRLVVATFVIASGMALFGAVSYLAGLALVGGEFAFGAATLAALAGIVVLSGRAFLRALLLNPGVLAASSQYSLARVYPLWERLTPWRLQALDALLVTAFGTLFAAAAAAHAAAGAWLPAAAIALSGAVFLAVPALAAWRREPAPARPKWKGAAPNILMIGSDTLRADRLNGYRRHLTPNLSQLVARATLFSDCYVPCARTAPSLVSMLTGTWPHTHRVRDTFVRPEDTRLPVAGLPEILARGGYETAAVGDWAASDITKFNFDFAHMDVPPDQWNMKYLLRQGPKDMRLFLSLFTQNLFGKALLPEIYFLGGVPLTEEVGCDTRRMISRLAERNAPFFLLSFMATNHPPFSSKYPYYAMYADQRYRGPSKFAMSKLTDPYEIIRRQGEPKTEFDLDQIIDLYDGCVKNFDDEVGRILRYLEASELARNTIVVVFSDHGMEFFEHETWGQGNSAIGDFSARVPLVVADPGAPRGLVVPSVVRTIDLAPTLLEMVDIPRPPYMEGVSLAGAIRGEKPSEDLPAFYETGVWLTDLPGTPVGHVRYPDLPDLLEVPDKRLGTIAIKPSLYDLVIAAKDRMVRVGDWKLTYQPLERGALWKLFNVRRDPACQDDVLAEHPDVVARLRPLLEQWMLADPANGGARAVDRAAA